MPPKVLAKTNDRASGVLPINAATRAATFRQSAARLKLEVRRLPPGLTLGEFEEILGQEWKLGNGKVDWREYRQGKIKTALGKVPEQSRCYIHVVSESLVKDFEARFLMIVFHDKAGTHRNPELRHLPPTLGFAPNQRTILNSKARTDSRQGTIDQDPEFIKFLEAETQPISKPTALDAVGSDKAKSEKVETKSTPLIEALKEKKANKAKAAEAKAAASKEEKKDGKGHAKSDSKDVPVLEKSGKPMKAANTQKIEQAPKDASKAANKQVTAKQQQQQRPASPQSAQIKPPASPAKAKKGSQNVKAQNVDKVTASPAATVSAAPSQQRGPRQRGNQETIKRMFQKDLGIKPRVSPTKEGASAPPTQIVPAASQSTSNPTAASPTIQASTAPTEAQTIPKVPIAPKQKGRPPTPSATTKAYLKHANPSQGMTEILIQQALSQYGDVLEVKIDSRKGTAIAVFKETSSLKKAMEAKRVSVASGHVEVLEFRERSAPAGGGRSTPRGGRGGARGGRGGSQATEPSTTGDTEKATG